MQLATRPVVQAAFLAALAYLCVGELLPYPVIKSTRILQAWAKQEILLLAALSCLALLLASSSSSSSSNSSGCSGARCPAMSISRLLWALNIVPIVGAIFSSCAFMLSDNCPVKPGMPCDWIAIGLDAVGLISARLARLNLGVCLLLASRGHSGWLLGVTAGQLGYAEAIPLHRNMGWWCAGQSALHSVAYALFYLETGGVRSLWLDCFPAPLVDGRLNRLGLVNFLGLIAFVVLLPLALTALPRMRSRRYHLFQRLHLPVAALFVLGCALHDLPILIFAVPGLACWYLEWRTRWCSGAPSGGAQRRRRLSAGAHLLSGTSGPWMELTIDCPHSGKAARTHSSGLHLALRGQWVSLRVLPLGREVHPFSVAAIAANNGNDDAVQLSVLVSTRAGDWTRALVELTASPESSRFEVELAGPYPFGGGDWSLSGEAAAADSRQPPALLLLAGGTGVSAWLPSLEPRAVRDRGSRQRHLHLVWCVQSVEDYQALASRLPEQAHGVTVAVYVTRANPGLNSLSIGATESAADGGDAPTTALPTCYPPQGEGSVAFVSLAATLVGLGVGHWGWNYVEAALGLPRVPTDAGWAHQTLLGYSLSRRCLPVALTVASMAATTAACSLALAYARTFSSPRRRRPSTELGAVAISPEQPQEPLFTAASSSSPSFPSSSSSPPGDFADAAVAGGGAGVAARHQMHSGRPDFDTLVREATAGIEKRRLVVAACGPQTLLQAARKAVVAAQKECPGVRIEFCCGESAW
jgi:NAD(P)H-flavin reductase